jgi:hypothetical protein
MSILRNIKESLVHYSWELAYFDFDKKILTQGLDFSKIHIVKNPYKNKWFADPFILRDTELELTLLVEEFDYDVKRGRIAQIVIDKYKNAIVACDIILDLPTHLSFPVIYRIGDKIIVHPENSASGASFMYEYDESTKKLINPKKVLDEPVTDAIIVKERGFFKMFATKLPEPNGCNLRTYVSKKLTGPYTLSEVDKYPHYRARMAGQIITSEGKNIRPAQDCEGAYGKAVIFYDDHTEVGEIRPSSYKYAGVHTFNKLNDICIIDIKRFDYPLFVSFKNFIKKLK